MIRKTQKNVNIKQNKIVAYTEHNIICAVLYEEDLLKDKADQLVQW